MTQIHFDGPVEISPELAMALYETMPEVGRQGVAQVFAARLMSGPLTEKAVETAARVYAERSKISEASAKALREGVADRCREFGKNMVATPQVQQIVDDEIRKASSDFAKERIGSLLSAIPLEVLIAAASPIVADVVKACAHHYFTRSPAGQDYLLKLIQQVCEDAKSSITAAVVEELDAAAGPHVGTILSRSVGDQEDVPRRRHGRKNGENG